MLHSTTLVAVVVTVDAPIILRRLRQPTAAAVKQLALAAVTVLDLAVQADLGLA
jgi:hypothetical protein